MGLFNNHSLGESSIFLGTKFSPVANTKMTQQLQTSPLGRQSAHMNWQPQASPFSRQTPGTNQQLKFNPEGTLRLANWPEARPRERQAVAGTSQAVLGQGSSLSGAIITT